MSDVKTHKDLEVWREAMSLARELYLFTGSFPKEELYGLSSQMRRAAVSVPSNIAEGAARSSDKEFLQFLYISLGSLAELETQLVLAKEIGIGTSSEAESGVERVRKMLLGLIKHVKGKLC